MNKLFPLLLVSVLTVSCFLPIEVFPQSIWPSDAITTTGIGNITDGNVSRAQNEALIDAQKKALMQAVGRLMTFDLLDEHFFFLKETVFNQPADYIESYRVLYDSTLGDRYQITIQSTIAFQDLEDYLVATHFLTSQVKLPRILLMIAVQELRQSFYTCWWSFIDPEKELTIVDQTLRDRLQKNGFEVIDHTYVLQETTLNRVYGCLDVKLEAIQALGKQFKAEIAIIGNAQVELTDETEDLLKRSVQVSITAKAVKIEDGSIVATITTYMPATGDDGETAQLIALEKAASTFAHQIGEQISLRWVKESKGISLITLSVSGLSNYLEFSRLKSDLKKGIPEIQNLLQKTLSAEGALIEVESMLDAPSLAEQIRNKQFEDFTVSINNITPTIIELEVRSKTENLEQKQSKTNSTNGMRKND